MEGQQLLSMEEAAKRLGLKAGTIRAWARQRRLGSVRLGSRRLIPVAELERIVAENSVPAINPAS
jgi:excisionase family DNA binding protein